MKKKLVCLAAVLVVAGLSTGGVVAGKPKPIPFPIDCRFVLCAYPDCGPDEHTEIPQGQCCPVCVPN